MFEDSGRKLRTIAMVVFVLTVVSALISLISCIVAGGGLGFLLGLISAAVSVLAGWIGAINNLALADAAEFSQEAAENTRTILKLLNDRQNGGTAPAQPSGSGFAGRPAAPKPQEPAPAPKPAPAATSAPKKYDTNYVPAWKRVQMEQDKQD